MFRHICDHPKKSRITPINGVDLKERSLYLCFIYDSIRNKKDLKR
jgi:hypothetical protein